jgi:hypothetical protein
MRYIAISVDAYYVSLTIGVTSWVWSGGTHRFPVEVLRGLDDEDNVGLLGLDELELRLGVGSDRPRRNSVKTNNTFNWSKLERIAKESHDPSVQFSGKKKVGSRF